MIPFALLAPGFLLTDERATIPRTTAVNPANKASSANIPTAGSMSRLRLLTAITAIRMARINVDVAAIPVISAALDIPSPPLGRGAYP
jgi:hypothetical protein